MPAKILIVDDSAFARRTLRQLLEEKGHVVVEVPDGAQALEAYFVQRPDLVILDLVMHGMTGLEALVKIREIEAAARVIVVTADIQAVTAAEVKAAGAAALLNKPIRRETLGETLQKVLEGVDAWN